ncbi:MAG: glutamine synthetase adenylyltransferase, partial [Deltaproteobacteria bacterium]|nr:glutamine synthetase adenylyltransferase [Deltaproteobacteria bacterium]
GLLSLVAGLLTASGIGIRYGLMTTRRDPTPAALAKILDFFEVEAGGVQENAVFWDSFGAELKGLVGKVAAGELDAARQGIIDRICAVMKRQQSPSRALLPVSIRFDNDFSETMTVLRLRSEDTPGFLFSFANALAMLEINIESAEIVTRGGEVRDTFWIQDLQRGKIVNPEKLQQLRAACALIKQFTYLLPRSANPGLALRQFGDLVNQMLFHPEWVHDLGTIRSQRVLNNIAALMGVSRFLWEDFLRMQYENLFPMISDPGLLEKKLGREDFLAELRTELAAAPGDQEQVAVLNSFKDRHMFRIDLQHITHHIGDIRFSTELTDLAEVVVEQMALLCFRQLEKRYGSPRLGDGRPCPWSVLAIGKFGGREMGFASDIELLFVYGAAGSSDGEQGLDNGSFFEKLVRLFLRDLKARREGIFHIDLRLRPHGDKGSLACSLEAFRNYYSRSGPAYQYERMALVKLRPVAGDPELGKQLMALRDAFVFNGQPLDIDNILHLRRRQMEEMVPPGTVNVKYGRGGLVDLEYFIQAQQIQHGAANPALRVAHTMVALEQLRQAGIIDEGLADRIHRAYRCLRRLIDALRAVRGNAQDLTVPAPGSPDFGYLARRLGYEDGAGLRKELDWSLALGAELWEPWRPQKEVEF